MGRKTPKRRAAPQPTVPSPIADYIHERTTEGTHHSQGAFTISADDAWRKLAAFQLTSPEQWILVLVQAANRGGASSIKVNQYAGETHVAIAAMAIWTWEQLATVLEGQPTEQPALLSLGVAVRALTGHPKGIHFTVTAPNGTTRKWNGEAFVDHSLGLQRLFVKGQTVFKVDHAAPTPADHFFSSRASARAELTALNQALVRRCAASSVPITCDGLRISGLDRGDPPPAFHHPLPVALLPLEHSTIPPADFSAALEWHEAKRVGVKIRPATFTRPTLSPRPLFGVALLTAMMQTAVITNKIEGPMSWLTQGSSQLLWVLDGVTVRRSVFTLKGSLGVTVAASAQGLKTDLSGLKLIENEELTSRRHALKKCLQAAVRTLAEQEREMPLVVKYNSTKASTAIGVAALLGGAAFPLAWMVGVPVGLALLYYGYSTYDQATIWEETLVEEMRGLSQRVARAFDSLD